MEKKRLDLKSILCQCQFNEVDMSKRYKKRICPDCGVTELDKGYRYCSECALDRRYFSHLLATEKWRINNPDKYKECYTKKNQSEKGKLRMKIYKQTPECKRKNNEYGKNYYNNVTKPNKKVL